jgi:hypothetical protein
MPDFDEIPHLTITPTCCVFCGDVAGPFVTMVPERWIEGYGVVAVCAGQGDHSLREAAGLEQMARHKTMVDGPVHARVKEEHDRQTVVIGELREQLDAFEHVREVIADLPPLSEPAATITG